MGPMLYYRYSGRKQPAVAEESMPPRTRRESPIRRETRIRKHLPKAEEYWSKWPIYLAEGDLCQAGEKGWGPWLNWPKRWQAIEVGRTPGMKGYEALFARQRTSRQTNQTSAGHCWPQSRFMETFMKSILTIGERNWLSKTPNTC